MTIRTGEWRSRAYRLAEDLMAAGKLWSAPWREAVCAVPRHELVPEVLRRDPDGSWHRLDTSTDQGRAGVARSGVLQYSAAKRSY
jgi:hypothetical protein